MSLPCALNRKNSMEAYDKAERRVLRRAAREHVDASTAARVRVLDAHRRSFWLVRSPIPRLELLAVSLGERRAHIALVLDRASENCSPCPAARAGLLLALGDDNLVLNVVIHHVHLVLVRLLWMCRVGR